LVHPHDREKPNSRTEAYPGLSGLCGGAFLQTSDWNHLEWDLGNRNGRLATASVSCGIDPGSWKATEEKQCFAKQ